MCGEFKSVEFDYNKSFRVKNGEKVYRPKGKCKSCQGKYTAKKLKERKQNDPEYRTQRNRQCSESYYKRMNENPELIRSKARSNWKKRMQDPNQRVKHRLRSLLSGSFSRQGFSKNSRTQEILGCDWETFKQHIESQFVEGMTWENHGEWHYDHIKPVSLAKTEAEVIELNHYTNFQPLWAEDNLKKSNKY